MVEGAENGLDESSLPQPDQAGAAEKPFLRCGQEQAIPSCPRSTPRAPQPLQEGRDGERCIDLDDSIKVTDIDAQLQSAGRHNRAVPPLGECRLRLTPFIQAQ